VDHKSIPWIGVCRVPVSPDQAQRDETNRSTKQEGTGEIERNATGSISILQL
jgi:hypothetical protein